MMAEHLVLEGKLDLAAVGPLHASFLEKAGQDIVLDLSNVSLFGALCLQTCIAAARNANDAGNGFQLINASDHILNQLSCMGMTPEFIAEGAL